MPSTFTAAAVSHRGGIRETNQDNLFFGGIYRTDFDEDRWEHSARFEDGAPAVFAVFDGMGGLESGERAALLAAESLSRKGREAGEDIGDAIAFANRRICEEIQTTRMRMGSTCVILEEKAGSFRVWNVGDSRAYRMREGRLEQLSVDHTEAESARSAALIRGEAANTRESMEHVLTQHLGIEEEEFVIEPAVTGWMDARPGDQYLLCSDGLYGMVGEEEIADVLSGLDTVKQKCRRLEDMALRAGGRDNITILILQVLKGEEEE